MTNMLFHPIFPNWWLWVQIWFCGTARWLSAVTGMKSSSVFQWNAFKWREYSETESINMYKFSLHIKSGLKLYVHQEVRAKQYILRTFYDQWWALLPSQSCMLTSPVIAICFTGVTMRLLTFIYIADHTLLSNVNVHVNVHVQCSVSAA